MGMTESFKYKNGVMPSETRLTLGELEALLHNNGDIIRKHPGNLANFIARVIKSFVAHQETIVQLNRDVAMVKTMSESNLPPVDRAVKILESLTPEHLEQVLDRNYTNELFKLDKAMEDNELMRLGYINESNRVRGVLLNFLDKAALSAGDREMLMKAIEASGYRIS